MSDTRGQSSEAQSSSKVSQQESQQGQQGQQGQSGQQSRPAQQGQQGKRGQQGQQQPGQQQQGPREQQQGQQQPGQQQPEEQQQEELHPQQQQQQQQGGQIPVRHVSSQSMGMGFGMPYSGGFDLAGALRRPQGLYAMSGLTRSEFAKENKLRETVIELSTTLDKLDAQYTQTIASTLAAREPLVFQQLQMISNTARPFVPGFASGIPTTGSIPTASVTWPSSIPSFSPASPFGNPLAMQQQLMPSYGAQQAISPFGGYAGSPFGIPQSGVLSNLLGIQAGIPAHLWDLRAQQHAIKASQPVDASWPHDILFRVVLDRQGSEDGRFTYLYDILLRLNLLSQQTSVFQLGDAIDSAR
eukprot:jgi/Hompol1/3652/HPOL_006663-RA